MSRPRRKCGVCPIWGRGWCAHLAKRQSPTAPACDFGIREMDKKHYRNYFATWRKRKGATNDGQCENAAGGAERAPGADSEAERMGEAAERAAGAPHLMAAAEVEMSENETTGRESLAGLLDSLVEIREALKDLLAAMIEVRNICSTCLTVDGMNPRTALATVKTIAQGSINKHMAKAVEKEGSAK